MQKAYRKSHAITYLNGLNSSVIQLETIKSYMVVQEVLLGDYWVGNNSCSPFSMRMDYIL